MPTSFEKLSHPENAAAVTPHATNPLADPGILFVGGAGDVSVTTVGGDDVVFSGVAAGSYVAVQVSHVKVLGTTASNILVLY